MTSPTVTGSSFGAVAAVSPTDIWAVGSQSSGPLIENFNGSTWAVFPSPTVTGGELFGVSALSSSDVWAVGTNGSGAPLVEFFNGSSWSVQTQPAGSGLLKAVTAISPTDVWAVGGTGSAELIENFNGSTWSVVQAPFGGNASLSGISAISSTDIFAVGATVGERPANQVLQFNGTAWSELSSLPSGQEAAQAVDAISPTNVWVAGTAGIENFNGTSWTVVPASVGDLVAISGTSANNIYAAGYTTTAAGPRVSVVEQWNGTSWSAVASANPNGILDVTGVTALSNGTVVTVGNTSGTGGGGFIETNATTAAPAIQRFHAGQHCLAAGRECSAATPAAATKPSRAPRPNNIHAVGTSATTVVAVGTLENDSSTLGTKTKWTHRAELIPPALGRGRVR